MPTVLLRKLITFALSKEREVMNFLNIVKGVCPNCAKNKVFESSGIMNCVKIPKMHDHCQNCGYKFSREPGFFFGAMYVSYALVVAEMISIAIVCKLILSLGNLTTFIAMAITALILSRVNFRFSRLIWMHLFIKERK